jgi:hypothetical protein
MTGSRSAGRLYHTGRAAHGPLHQMRPGSARIWSALPSPSHSDRPPEPVPADAAQAAWTRATARLLVPVRLLALGRRYAGVARCLGSTKLRHPSRQRLNLRPKRQDQSILAIARQSAQVKKLGHPQLKSKPACSRQPHTNPTAKRGGLSRYESGELNGGSGPLTPRSKKLPLSNSTRPSAHALIHCPSGTCRL